MGKSFSNYLVILYVLSPLSGSGSGLWLKSHLVECQFGKMPGTMRECNMTVRQPFLQDIVPYGRWQHQSDWLTD